MSEAGVFGGDSAVDALMAHGLLNSVAAIETGANLLVGRDLGDNTGPVLEMMSRQADFLAASLREWIAGFPFGPTDDERPLGPAS